MWETLALWLTIITGTASLIGLVILAVKRGRDILRWTRAKTIDRFREWVDGPRREVAKLQSQVDALQGQVAELAESRASETEQGVFPIDPNTPERRLGDVELGLQNAAEARTALANEVRNRLEALEKSRDELRTEDKRLEGWIDSLHVMRTPGTGGTVYIGAPELMTRIDELESQLRALRSEQNALISRVMSQGEEAFRQAAETLAERIGAEIAQTPALSRITVAQVVDNLVSNENPRGWSVQLLDTLTHNLPVYVSRWQEWETLKAQLLA